jgi:site-specific DNA recombinase
LTRPPNGRAVGYLRVSTDEQADRGYGLEVQRERVEEFCRREGLRLLRVYADPGVSGASPLEARPGLTEALEAVRRGRARALVVARLDRLARDTLEALLIEREFEAAGAGVLSAEGLNGSTPEYKMLRAIVHAVGEAERARIVARMVEGKRRKAAEGGYAGGRPPFGYAAREGQLAPVAAELELVRGIFRAVVHRGWSVRRIAAALDAERALDRRWHATTVARILRRELYKQGPLGSRVVDPRVWNRASAILAERRRA